MTTTDVYAWPPAATPDVAEWLFDDPRAADTAIADVLQRDGSTTLAKLKAVAGATLTQQLAEALRSVMHESVADVIVAGWRQHRVLVNAARDSAQRGINSTIALDPYRARFVREPTVDVIVNKLSVLQLTGQLNLQMEITDVVVDLHAGTAVALRNGQASVTGSVAVADQDLVRRTAHWPLPALIPLGSGVDLTMSFLG